MVREDNLLTKKLQGLEQDLMRLTQGQADGMPVATDSFVLFGGLFRKVKPASVKTEAGLSLNQNLKKRSD